jgi:hypothetical protein
MNLERLLTSIIRLKTARAFLEEPSHRLALNDLSLEGEVAYRQICLAIGLIEAAVLDLTDAVRDRQPMYVRSAV